MKDYVHGFLSFDLPQGVSEYSNGNSVVIEAFRELFTLCELKKT